MTRDRVAGRACGECTACCKAFHIAELDKPANVLCHHCSDTGCSIHAARPPVCRDYFCLWRRIAAMPDGARPDRLGIIFSLVKGYMPVTPFERLCIVARAIDDPAAFNTAAARTAIAMLFAEGSLPVFIAVGEERTLIHPDPALRAAILDPTNPRHAKLTAAALSWRQQYGLPPIPGGDAVDPDPDRPRDYSAVNVSAPANSIAML